MSFEEVEKEMLQEIGLCLAPVEVRDNWLPKFLEVAKKHCLDKTKVKETIKDWVASLRSGSGDYKLIHTEDYMKLLIAVGVAGPADKELLDDLQKEVRART